MLPIDIEQNLRARQRLIELLRTGQALALTGAGVSVWAGYRTWDKVIRVLGDAVREYNRGEVDPDVVIQDNPDPLHCAQRLGTYLGPRFPEFIRTEFGPNGVSPHDVLYRIVSFPFKHIVTLNFDTSAEQAHAATGQACGTIRCSTRRELASFLRGMEGQGYERQVVHLHGIYYDPPEVIALTEQGYRSLYGDQFFLKMLWLLMVSKRLVFLGFGFKDSDFSHALRTAARDIHENDPCHFAIVGIRPDQNANAIRNTYNDNYLTEPVFYEVLGDRENSNHQGFVELINGISDELGGPVRILPEAMPPQPPQPHGPEPEDLRRAEHLGDVLLERVDPGGDDVQG